MNNSTLDKNSKKDRIINWRICDFKIGAPTVDDIPPTEMNEIAFAGRSNVGKSSIINALTDRNSLTRTSKKPGCTQQLNFFMLDNKFMLVDMPGYGYAKQSKTTIAGWSKTIQDYLGGRRNLMRIFLLIDSRRGVKESDEKIMELLDDKAVTYQIVLTKCDKSTGENIANIRKKFAANSLKHPAMHPEILETSSLKNIGINELKESIESLV